MKRVFNFCAGPAMLPPEVMETAQRELLDWQGLGCSVMEISHRSTEFIAMAEQAEQDFRDLLGINDDYHVLFLHGGGRGQFAAVPLNLATQNGFSEHIVSGSWSRGAVKEMQKYHKTSVLAESFIDQGVVNAPNVNTLCYSDTADFVHYCPNETVDGIEISAIPDTGDVPLVADMSSCILSKPVPVEKFGVIYAGAQKNIGPSGLAIAIVRKDLAGRALPQTPSILDYQLAASHDSMYNTPPTFAWYLAGLVFKWVKQQGGVATMQAHNHKKAALLYQAIDASELYQNNVAVEYRSRMNVTFQLRDPALDAAFLKQAEAQGLMALKGHRMVGGMRASIYNAMPLEGVQALVNFMQEFERKA
ncbi:3-phosphoserine/phosphohydroxythreonine transaminase [Aestuariibacter salexigens]|uniref:3-phosphoserine/phosphohydroxythreonine transaminase n=1 Tax=Aestuariibacter salexigens TaxID=226010 RepID=UPI0003F85334|nr:3-phosphoserine/phosphohydroxythreonine transaminase [Aestuariibacter salexigens]